VVAGEDNGEWISVAAAARFLGVSRQAIQNRIKRGKIENRHDNRGNPIVRVVAPAPNPVSGATDATTTTAVVSQSEARPIASGASEMVPASVLSAIIASHQDALNRMERQHLAELTRLERAYQSAADALMAKVSAVLVASRPRRSWWRW